VVWLSRERDHGSQTCSGSPCVENGRASSRSRARSILRRDADNFTAVEWVYAVGPIMLALTAVALLAGVGQVEFIDYGQTTKVQTSAKHSSRAQHDHGKTTGLPGSPSMGVIVEEKLLDVAMVDSMQCS